jgi:hypothetical protein
MVAKSQGIIDKEIAKTSWIQKTDSISRRG